MKGIKRNQNYIEWLELEDVPWTRLTTPYGRATNFPIYFEGICSNDAAVVSRSMEEIEVNLEHQGTLWHATPFAMIFLMRILKQALPMVKVGNIDYYLVDKLLTLFVVIAECCHMGDEMEHAAPLHEFSDMLNEEYLWSEEYDEEQDEIRYEENPFPDNLFYSFYYYSYQALLNCKPLLEYIDDPSLNLKADILKEKLV